MSEVNVQLKGGAAAQVPASASVAEALKRLDRDAAKQALAARVNGSEVDLAFKLDSLAANGGAAEPVEIVPVLPGTREGWKSCATRRRIC
jgi:hypothetical protein